MTIQSQHPAIVLSNTRRLFSHPHRLNSSAFLRREIADRMREKLALVKLEVSRVVDAGCGAAEDLPHLRQTFPEARVIGLDASETLLRSAKQSANAASTGVEKLMKKFLPSSWHASNEIDLLCANFAELPFASNSLDVIWSNLALHWHPQPDFVLKEWRRSLRVGGLCMFSCFGPDTLKELRQAFVDVDEQAHLLDFIDMHDFGDMAVHAGLATPVMDMEKLSLRYEKIEQLLADVRALGGNPLPRPGERVLSRAKYRQLLERLEAMRGSDGRIPLTIEVVYGHAFKPQASKRESGESIVQFMPRQSPSK